MRHHHDMPDTTPHPTAAEAPPAGAGDDPAQGRAAAAVAASPTPRARDRVDAAGDASFPASDPPSWWGGG
jgi:hypothetical protein